MGSAKENLLLGTLSLAMSAMGVLHFMLPTGFLAIVPDYLPYPLALVYISGAFELGLGLALLAPPLRRWAAWGLIALFIAVFPANVNMAIHHLPFGETPTPPALLWARLPLQLVFIYWAWHFARRRPTA